MPACASQKRINLCPSLQTIDHPTETLGLRKWWFHLTRLCWNSNSKLVNRKIQFCNCSSPSDFGRHCTSADQELCCTTWHLLHRIRRTKQKNSQEVACLCQTLFKVKQNKKSYPWIQPPLYTSWSSNAVVLHVIRDVLSGKKKASAHDARKLVKRLRACVIFYRVE